jgi:5-methylcytosine-specific restriction endonuclease McrA
LRSRERAAAEKRDNKTCQVCGKRKSAAKGREVKTEIHHLDGVEWNKIIDYVYRHLLVSPDKLVTLCVDCHKHVHDTGEL